MLLNFFFAEESFTVEDLRGAFFRASIFLIYVFTLFRYYFGSFFHVITSTRFILEINKEKESFISDVLRHQLPLFWAFHFWYTKISLWLIIKIFKENFTLFFSFFILRNILIEKGIAAKYSLTYFFLHPNYNVEENNCNIFDSVIRNFNKSPQYDTTYPARVAFC